MALGFFGSTNDPAAPDSADALARKRRLIDALMMQKTDTSPVQHWTQGLARVLDSASTSYQDAKLSEKEAVTAKERDRILKAIGGVEGDAAPAGPLGVSYAGGDQPAMKTADPVSANLEPWQKGLLNAIAGPESNGQYDIRYTPKGGAKFAGFDQHPGVFEPGPAGPSSAAGRYQFTKTTWDRMGGGNFSPENQDQRALQLASQDYQRRTGRDLGADIQKNGFTPEIAKVLAPTWAGLGANPRMAMSAYAATVGRGQNPADLPSARATEVGGAPFTPQADPGMSAAMFDPSRLSGGGADYTLGARGMNGNNNGMGMTEIAPGSFGPMSGWTAARLGGGAPEASAPADLQMVARLLRGDAPTTETPQPAPQPPQVAAAPQPNVPLPPVRPDSVDPISAATAARAANPQAGDQRVALNSPEAERFTRLEGQSDPDLPSAGAVPAGGAPMPPRQGMSRQAMLAAALSSPALSAADKQAAMQLYTATQKDQNVTHIDLGNSIGIMDGRGNIIRTIPKAKDPQHGVIGEDQYGNKQYGFIDPQTGTVRPSQGGAGPSPASADGQALAIPPAPPGVDPKIWRAEKTKELATGGKPMTENESNANALGMRMEKSNTVLNKLEKEGTGFWSGVGNMIPGVGNYVTPEKRQLYDQAKREFINSVLRKESGASISDGEFASADKQYFPKPGDSEKVIEQKKRSREIAVEGVKSAAGKKASAKPEVADPLGIR
jgi:muramidase (phage lysozyme)